MRYPRPLAETTNRANVIVVAKLGRVPQEFSDRKSRETILPVPPPATPAPTSAKPHADFVLLGDGDATPLLRLEARTLAAPLKGQIAETFPAYAPRPAPGSSTYGETKLQSGDTVLLFLRRVVVKKQTYWVVVDNAVPAVRLTDNGAKQAAARAQIDTASPVLPRVVSLILPSLADAELRPLSAYYLAAVRDTRLPNALVPYADDPDLHVRDTVLTGLATNQSVDVLPRIIRLARTLARQKKPAPVCVRAIGKLKNPKAVETLNHLLFEMDGTTRQSAVFALGPVANRSSVPFLMVALQDKTIAYEAYLILHRLARIDGPPRDPVYFARHRAQATQAIVRWATQPPRANRLASGKKQ